MELIKKKNKKKNNQQSEEEFYNINEIEDSDDSRNENCHNTYRKRKRMRISDTENENEIKDKSRRCFIIVFRFGSHRCLDSYTKESLVVNKTRKNFLFRLTEELDDEQNTSFNSISGI